MEKRPRQLLILASNSPRRKELLAGLDINYEVRVIPGIDESFPEDLPANEVPQYVAHKKSLPYLEHLADNEVLLTADTVVIVGNTILGKPANEADACRMLRLLSGKTHHVVTGVCVRDHWQDKAFSVTTEVDFKPLSEDYIGCRGLRGSYYNVMGLPVQRVYQELRDNPEWASLLEQ